MKEQENLIEKQVEKIDDTEVYVYGKKTEHLMYIVLPAFNENLKQLELLVASLCIQYAYQIVTLYLKESESNEIIKKVFKKFKTKKNYLFTYGDVTVDVMKQLQKEDILRAYFVSPRFERNTSNLSWRIETEILMEKSSPIMKLKEFTYFMKNSPCHIKETKNAADFSTEDSLKEVMDWLNGERETKYTDFIMWIAMIAGFVAGILVGGFVFNSFTTGAAMGIALGMITGIIIKKIK